MAQSLITFRGYVQVTDPPLNIRPQNGNPVRFRHLYQYVDCRIYRAGHQRSGGLGRMDAVRIPDGFDDLAGVRQAPEQFVRNGVVAVRDRQITRYNNAQYSFR
jgi:hypothetical protein